MNLNIFIFKFCDENTKTNFNLKNGNNTFNETINNDSNQFIYELTNKTIELNISESKPFLSDINITTQKRKNNLTLNDEVYNNEILIFKIYFIILFLQKYFISIILF